MVEKNIQPYSEGNDKAELGHVENVKPDELIVDVEAKGYVDHNVVIDDETNRRLRKLINWR